MRAAMFTIICNLLCLAYCMGGLARSLVFDDFMNHKPLLVFVWLLVLAMVFLVFRAAIVFSEIEKS